MTCQKTLDELDLTLNLVMMKNSNSSKESVENYINQEITLKEFEKQKHLIDLSYGYTYE